MPTGVQEPFETAVRLTNNEHRLQTDLTGEVVARLAEILRIAEPDPRTREDPQHLEIEEILVVDLLRLQQVRGQWPASRSSKLIAGRAPVLDAGSEVVVEN